jgi:hypothetical protein
VCVCVSEDLCFEEIAAGTRSSNVIFKEGRVEFELSESRACLVDRPEDHPLFGDVQNNVFAETLNTQDDLVE